MVVQFARWGHSVALRIPSAFAREICAFEGRSADLRLEDGKLVVTPLAEVPSYELSALLAGITEENLHGEVGSGPAVGNEFS
jgi:antitoxin component of MazEF toxin-antitoxin module